MDSIIVKLTINGSKNFGSILEIPLWSKIHLYDGNDPEWFEQFKKRIPSTGCGCAKGFDEILETLPPVFTSPQAFFERGIEWHNAVNRKLGYAEIDLETAYMLWRHRRKNTNRTRCLLTIATGKEFRDLLDVTRPSLKRYAEKNNADFIELTNETEPWWGFEKFRARHFAGQYDETLFVDADCVINPDAPSIFGRSESLAMHDSYRFLQNAGWLPAERKTIANVLGLEFEDRQVGLNSGVVYAKQKAASVWTRPPDAIPMSPTSEQTFIEQTAFKLGYSTLDDKWNWQIYFPDFWKMAPDAWIVHFAGEKNKSDNARKMLKIWGEQS